MNNMNKNMNNNIIIISSSSCFFVVVVDLLTLQATSDVRHMTRPKWSKGQRLKSQGHVSNCTHPFCDNTPSCNLWCTAEPSYRLLSAQHAV